MWFGHTHSSIALDAGPASIALCQLTRKRGSLGFHRWGALEDPLRERTAGEQLDRLPLERATRLVEQTGFRGHQVSIALKPPDAFFQAAKIPDSMRGAPRPQWLTMLRFEAARDAQCDPEELEVDFWRLPPGNRSGANVMITAVHRPVIARWCEALRAMGLTLRQVDVAPCALLRAAWHTGLPRVRPGADAKPEQRQVLWGVLDIGFSGALLAVALNSHCVYVRPLMTGGDALSLALVDALEVDYAVAETLKRQYTGPRPTPARAEGQPPSDSIETLPPAVANHALDGVDQALHAVLRARIRHLATEIERAFAYPMENYPDATPTAIYLCGGGARLGGLPEALHRLLGVEVALLDPCSGLLPPARGMPMHQSHHASLTACVGLALGDVA
ncbi:MAG: pilus assembly protein PilM [Planctomycetes bacterium]|nr:pilus assembly protein PilM [Planctomycetota bacterium]